MTAVWAVGRVIGAFVVALLAPLLVLVVVTGLVRTGLVGVIAFVAWATATVFLVRMLLNRRRLH